MWILGVDNYQFIRTWKMFINSFLNVNDVKMATTNNTPKMKAAKREAGEKQSGLFAEQPENEPEGWIPVSEG
jgi:hypothetical protein